LTNVLERAAKVKHPYYSFDKIMSYNAVYNFIPGGRGIGKTYGSKKMAISNSINKGQQFIYLRRYKDETQKSKDTFFADIAHEYPEWDFRINGDKAERAAASTRDEKKREWILMGYFMSLSVAQNVKSVAYPLVTLIIYDEFIIEKGNKQYIRDESTAFDNFYLTVDRYKDKTRVLFLANAVSITNPFFLEYEIRPTGKEIQRLRPDPSTGLPFIAVQFVESEEFAKSIYQTRFGAFIKDSDYATYAVGNQFSDNSDDLIELKTSRATYVYTLETAKGSFSVWVDNFVGKYYALARRPKQEVIYVTDPARMTEDKMLLLRNDRQLGILRTVFSRDMMRFDSPVTRNAMLDIFKR
jgi:hypothetical protein